MRTQGGALPFGAALLAALWLMVAPAPAMAQDLGVVQSDILVLDTERLFNSSLIGQRLAAEYQTEREKLIARNREIEAELRAEEQALTDKRATMTPAEFRDAADAFDARVRSIRQENERAGRELERARELAPLTMMRLAEPVLVQLMLDAGGRIVIDHRQVLLRADAIDITDAAIARIDAEIGDGTGSARTGEESPADTPPAPPAAPEMPPESQSGTPPGAQPETPQE